MKRRLRSVMVWCVICKKELWYVDIFLDDKSNPMVKLHFFVRHNGEEIQTYRSLGPNNFYNHIDIE